MDEQKMFVSDHYLDEEPRDHYNAIYLNIFYQGLSNLLPWNVLIIAQEYFAARLSKLPEARDFIIHFTLIFMTMKFIFLVSGISASRKCRPDQQIFWSTVGNAGVFIVIFLVCVFEMFNLHVFYYLIVSLVILASLLTAFMEAGFMSLLSSFPPNYTQSYIVGHGFAGLTVALLKIASVLSTDSGVSTAFAELYFGISMLIIIASVLLFHQMRKLDTFQFYYQRGLAAAQTKEKAESLAEMSGMPLQGHSSTMQIVRQTYDLVLTVYLLTWVNIIIWPAVIIMTETTQAFSSPTYKTLFHAIVMFIGCIFDLVGKMVPGFSVFAIRRLPFLPLALLRLLILPILLLGNIKIASYKLPFQPLLPSDLLLMTMIAIKSLSGGYLGTLCMIWAPLRVQPPDRSRAVAILIYAIGLGLFVGSLTLLLLQLFLQAISTKIDIPH